MGLVRDKNFYVQKIFKILELENTEISKDTIDLILSTYVKCKIESLELGNSIKEEGIGTTIPSWRRVSDAFTDVPFTSKIKTNVDKELKNRLTHKLGNSPEYRKAVGAVEL